MQRVDHSMIYVLIAGTYTPSACIVLDGWVQYAALTVAWGIAVGGILQKIFVPQLSDGYSIAMQAAQGWLALPFLLPLAQRLPGEAVLLMAVGGIFYTIGMLFLVTQRPQLWPRVFSYHELFHVFVIAGSASHYTMTVWYIVPFVVV
jgi:hemolysin III